MTAAWQHPIKWSQAARYLTATLARLRFRTRSIRYAHRRAPARMCSTRSTSTSGPSTSRNSSSSDRQKPWHARAAAQIGQWFSTSSSPRPRSPPAPPPCIPRADRDRRQPPHPLLQAPRARQRLPVDPPLLLLPRPDHPVERRRAQRALDRADELHGELGMGVREAALRLVGERPPLPRPAHRRRPRARPPTSPSASSRAICCRAASPVTPSSQASSPVDRGPRVLRAWRIRSPARAQRSRGG